MASGRNNSRIYINIRGGLGNQLFCYFAGEYLRFLLNTRVVYLYDSKSNVHHKTNSNIYSFNLSNKPIKTKSLKFCLYTFRIVLISLPQVIKKILSGMKIRDIVVSTIFEEVYDEKPITYFEQSMLIKEWVTNSKCNEFYLRGLFQDFDYFDNQPQKKITLLDSSTWFKKVSLKLNAIRPIILHVRLGDYLVEKENGLGVLSTDYYREAIIKVRKNLPSTEVWVFSNETSKAKILLSPIIDDKFKFIEEAEQQDPAEVLLAMSLGGAIIVSNSTFSLWSAKLSDSRCIVIVPEPFFRKNFIRSGSFPKSWEYVESKWLSEKQIKSLC